MRASLNRLGLVFTEINQIVDSVFLVDALATDPAFQRFDRGFRAMAAELDAHDRAMKARREAEERAFKAAWRWWNPMTWNDVIKGLGLYLGIMTVLVGFVTGLALLLTLAFP